MKKSDFLDALRTNLNGLSEADIQRSLDYYEEMINDRIEDGLSEEEAVKAIGSPKDIANDILKEIPMTTLIKNRVKPKRKFSALEIVLIVLGAPIWVSVLAAVPVIVLSLFAVIFAAITLLWAAVLTLAVVSIWVLIISPHQFALFGIWSGLFYISASLLIAGIGVFLFYGSLYTTKGLLFCCKKTIFYIKRRLIRKEASK